MFDLEPLYQQVHLHFQGLGRIEALLLTSFGLDVRYLEERILPSFFPDLGEGPASEPHRPLYEYLEENPVPISVMFDANNLVRGDKPVPPGGGVLKELRWQAHPMQGRNGCFHPKLIFALVKHDDGHFSLVIGCGSANLTQPGWGKNLEAFVLRTIRLREGLQDSMLVDAKELLDDLAKNVAGSKSLDLIRTAVEKSQPKLFGTRGYGWDYRPRLWHSAKDDSLSEFLRKEVLRRDLANSEHGWRVEILSPYYSEEPPQLLDWLKNQLSTTDRPNPPVLSCCPQIDGDFDIDPEIAGKYEALGLVTWSSLPAELIRSKLKPASGEALTRFLHAKVYRFWCANAEVLVCGSANATVQGCRDRKKKDGPPQGNDEACMIFSRQPPEGKSHKAWLQPLDAALDEHNCRSAPSQPDDQAASGGIPAFSARFDWASHVLELENRSDRILQVFLGSHAVKNLAPKQSDTSRTTSDQTGALFRSPTLRVTDAASADAKWLYLVEETNLHAKPPAPSMERTADELIQDWQQGFDDRLADRVARAESASEQLQRADSGEDWLDDVDTDRLNEIFLALWRFRKDIEALLGPELAPDEYARSRLQARIFGRGAMSLRYFVSRLQDASEETSQAKLPSFDTVDLYVSLLTVTDAIKQLSSKLKRTGFDDEFKDLVKELAQIKVAARNRLLKELATDSSYPPKALLQWVDTHFRCQFTEQRPT